MLCGVFVTLSPSKAGKSLFVTVSSHQSLPSPPRTTPFPHPHPPKSPVLTPGNTPQTHVTELSRSCRNLLNSGLASPVSIMSRPPVWQSPLAPHDSQPWVVSRLALINTTRGFTGARRCPHPPPTFPTPQIPTPRTLPLKASNPAWNRSSRGSPTPAS
jgi:hypothetical protein